MFGLRAGCGLIGMLGCAMLAAAAARLLPHQGLGAVAAAGLGGLAAAVAASAIEWVVHRYVYHRGRLALFSRIRDVHHRVHHHVYFPTWRYVTTGPPRRIALAGADQDAVVTSAWGNLSVGLLHSGGYLTLALALVVAPAWLVSRHPAFVLGSAAAAIVISDLLVRVHDGIHRPGSHPLVERGRWFAFLDRHHFIHHVDTDANVNFLLPLGDLVTGTLRTSLTAAEELEHGTHDQARARPIGRGEPARESLRAERERHRRRTISA